LFAVSNAKLGVQPGGWFSAGSNPSGYEMGITTDEHHGGKASGHIGATVSGFDTYMQEVMPGKFAGKSVRMTGYIKPKDVENWAGMWFRGDARGRSVSFDNMGDRPIKGNSDWTRYEIVLDVPNSSDIAIGVLLTGAGQVYFDDMTLEVVGPLTHKSVAPEMTFPEKPVNLDFEH
jgi:hypothetical protein